jgi:hypothetical protein
MIPPNFESIKDLEVILRKHVNESAINQALQDYKKWSSGLKEEKKEIVHLLYLLKTTEQRSGNTGLKNNKRIADIILSKAEIPNLDRRQSEEKSYLTLFHKQIGAKYQIEMEFKDQKGSKINKSIADLSI